MKYNLEVLYREYNRRRYVDPDPLACLYGYPQVRDREIVGLIASALAYGRVVQILRSVSWILETMGASPCDFLLCHSAADIQRAFAGFPRHRFADGAHVAALLIGIKHVIETYGSLNECFVAGNQCVTADDTAGENTVLPAMACFVNCLTSTNLRPGHLLAIPEKGSACKRLNLFLRWMVRSDRVDPGGWEGIHPSRLIVPLDTHMHRIGIQCGLTRRKQADMKTAIELTNGFRRIMFEDPVKYDFVLTRFGIREDMCLRDLHETLLSPECCM